MLDAIKDCDIFLDQFILGYYGMAAIEAISFGKPVFCYIKESCILDFGKDKMPFINTNPDNLLTELERYVSNKELCIEYGAKSRKFVEDYHDTYQLADHLTGIYNKVYTGN